ncbi:hypothetical protein AWZ03_011696 [Drosophila navojoa]|uniref:Uncharacterized protein n=1 Tax=Drosophila navojoa TaxID=7232 RepID=A0A484AZN0_DRONA|nr:hypothetical protein AWZ03_011696 [Drosophila navojoa]
MDEDEDNNECECECEYKDEGPRHATAASSEQQAAGTEDGNSDDVATSRSFGPHPALASHPPASSFGHAQYAYMTLPTLNHARPILFQYTFPISTAVALAHTAPTPILFVDIFIRSFSWNIWPLDCERMYALIGLSLQEIMLKPKPRNSSSF